MNLPVAATNFYVQEYWYITLNTKIGKIKTWLGKKGSKNPIFEPFEDTNYIFLTFLGQNQANLRIARNQKFQL